jgi:predicted alpha/beta superfamily hydrolase
MLSRLRAAPVQDLRLWLDSGEGEGDSDDNKWVTLLARQALLDAGYTEGKEFVYHLEQGATHSEAAWAARLPQVLCYLFPPERAPKERPTEATSAPEIAAEITSKDGLEGTKR